MFSSTKAVSVVTLGLLGLTNAGAVEVVVGSSESGVNSKTVTLPRSGLVCPSIVDSTTWLNSENYDDEFYVSMDGDQITVTRIDNTWDPSGWGLDLRFTCTDPRDYEEYYNLPGTHHCQDLMNMCWWWGELGSCRDDAHTNRMCPVSCAKSCTPSCYDFGRKMCKETDGCVFDGICLKSSDVTDGESDFDDGADDECLDLGQKKCRNTNGCAWNGSSCYADDGLDTVPTPSGDDATSEVCLDLGNKKCKKTKGCAWKVRFKLCMTDCKSYTSKNGCKEAGCRWRKSKKVCSQKD